MGTIDENRGASLKKWTQAVCEVASDSQLTQLAEQCMVASL